MAREKVFEQTVSSLTLLRGAWHGDQPYRLEFPQNWQINTVGSNQMNELTDAELVNRLRHPIGSLPLVELAQEKDHVLILADDLSRPTPLARLLPFVLEELSKAGVGAEAVTLLICGGTHEVVPAEKLQKKLPPELAKGMRVLQHDCRNGCEYLGDSPLGTPIWLDSEIMRHDLKIGIGSVYPHPAAGFSGGGKIMALGAAGFQTIQHLHDHVRVARHRAGDIDHPFRQEIDHITALGGLDFIVNVSLNQQRQVCGVYAGHPRVAFEQAVAEVRQRYKVLSVPVADVVISDMYPFDADLQFAFDRGLWVLEQAPTASIKVLLADCPEGMGGHALFPLKQSLATRLKRRLQSFRLAELGRLPTRLENIYHNLRRRNMTVYVISRYLDERELRQVLPKAKVLSEWQEAREMIASQLADRRVKAVIYQAAPLFLADQRSPR